MKGIMKKAVLILVLCCFALCLFACGSKYDENYVYDGQSLVGKWQEEDIAYEDYYTYEFFADGKMELKQFIYGMEVSCEVGTYTVDGNRLEVLFREDDGRVSEIENKFSITSDGELVMVRLSTSNQMQEVETVYVPFEPVFNLKNELVGTWENTKEDGECWIFDGNYEITIPNEVKEEKMLYSIKDDTLYMLYLIDPGEHKLYLEEPMIFTYKIDGNTLKLYGEIDYEFTKK